MKKLHIAFVLIAICTITIIFRLQYSRSDKTKNIERSPITQSRLLGKWSGYYEKSKVSLQFDHDSLSETYYNEYRVIKHRYHLSHDTLFIERCPRLSRVYLLTDSNLEIGFVDSQALLEDIPIIYGITFKKIQNSLSH